MQAVSIIAPAADLSIAKHHSSLDHPTLHGLMTCTRPLLRQTECHLLDRKGRFHHPSNSRSPCIERCRPIDLSRPASRPGMSKSGFTCQAWLLPLLCLPYRFIDTPDYRIIGRRYDVTNQYAYRFLRCRYVTSSLLLTAPSSSYPGLYVQTSKDLAECEAEEALVEDMEVSPVAERVSMRGVTTRQVLL